ncbi:DNA replication ATP-dependent helicase/nuclease DNA2 [Portunus trituberculatus]|uniref:DNA replication ATP-dependent helicase/nuclease DNA2 n=1 Tax=Portunus trituberculatus TaxID=210409 RepID=A0A5B7ERA7_PORTR|nr:DNA replication ATP-dependent helicase/nuclease DNA2 [Portunus trituberculatus]
MAINAEIIQRLVGEGAVAPWLQRVVAPTLEGAVVLVDTVGATEEARVSGSTLANHREARLVIEVARTLLKAGLGASDIGIIAPYRGQVRLVKKLLVEEVEEEDVEKVEVNTVDQYQGRDKMAIICSFVRCGKSSDKPAGILTDCRRLNVALTRAKRKLILIGDRATLTRYSSFSSLMKVLAPHQVYCLAQGTDGFQWQGEEEKCPGVELMEGNSCVKTQLQLHSMQPLCNKCNAQPTSDTAPHVCTEEHHHRSGTH